MRETIISILTKYPSTRENDDILISYYIGTKLKETHPQGTTSGKLLQMIADEEISIRKVSRERRRIQNEFPELKGRKKQRDEMAEEIKANGGKSSMHSKSTYEMFPID